MMLFISYLVTDKTKFLDLENLKFHEFRNIDTANKYYAHQSVKNSQEASIFSDEYTWIILDDLRVAGSRGMSAEEVHKRVQRKMHTSVSKSKVYGILKRLYQMNWVHRYYNQEKGVQYSVIAIDWGGILVDDKYDHLLVDKQKNYMSKKLFPIFLDFIKNATDSLDEDSDSRKWLPARNNYCKVCSKSHEADEFFNSILDIATAEFMDSKEYLEFLEES